MASTATSEVSEGPVLSLISKRLRALRKKLNRIAQMEESLAQGKPLNKEQEEVLRSKPAVSALFDELEKLRQPLSAAVTEELNLALTTKHAAKPSEPQSGDGGGDDSVVEDLLNLLYFGSMFDVKSHGDFGSMCLVRTHERECCLSYDYVADEEAADLLREEDLDLISKLGGLLISRPADSSLSHRNALQRCIEHAKAWLAKSDQLIDPNAEVTYGKLRERLQRIMASDYFTTSPEIKPPALEMAAAAANYASFQVSAQGASAPVPVQAEGSVGQYQQKDDETTTLQEQETGGSHSSSVQEHQKGEQEIEVPPQDVPAQHEQVNQDVVDAEHNQRELDSKDQQYIPRRGGYQNQRGRGVRGGGGHRGYSNGRGGRSGGRGGGPYQNGRGQQYDQPGNYYPGDYQNNRGSGGRGRGRGGGYNHRGPSAQGGHNPADVGVGA